MSTEALAQAFADTRAVLVRVTGDQLTLPTPCASWTVRELIDHMVGGCQWYGTTVNAGGSPRIEDLDLTGFVDRDYVAEYDAGVAESVAAFSAPGALERSVTLPWGPMPVADFLGLATTDAFVHGWDLARATGQSTDIDPALADALLAETRVRMEGRPRGGDGRAPFGPERAVPQGASAADRLAAFLGRTIG